MNEVVVALATAIIVSIVAPFIMARLLGAQRQDEATQAASIRAAERKADWERQDEVAARVEKVAKDAAAVQVATTKTLGDIHTLVNSDMTAARTESLAMVRALILALKAVPVGDRDNDAILAAETRANELEAILADRLVAQRKVEAQHQNEAAQGAVQ